MTLYETFVAHVRPVFESLVGEGMIGAWGLTGIGHPDTIIRLLGESPAPAAVQCIANLLDSPGGLKFFDGPAKPREIIAAARANGVGIMGIRAVQAGALTARSTGRCRRTIPRCATMRAPPASAASRSSLARPGGACASLRTVARRRHAGARRQEPQELAECVAAAEAGPLPPDLIARVDQSAAAA